MSHKHNKLFLWVSLIFLFTSCTKAIELELKDANPQIVIEGKISTIEGEVKITKTSSFYSSNTFPMVSGAIVTITDDLGNSETLTEVLPGIYKTITLQGAESRTYTLNVIAEGKQYTAVSSMPQLVPIDTLVVKETLKWGEIVKGIQVQFHDPATTANYYRFSLIRNSKPFTAKFIFEDRLYNGKLIEYDIAQASEEPLETGDSIEVSLYCIDQNVYNYFVSIPSNWEPPAVPANPLSNISNNALGYFSAETVSRKIVIVNN